MNELSARNYEVLVDKIVAQIVGMEGQMLVRSHRIGKLVDEFKNGLDCGRYEQGAGMDMLIDDLTAKGVLHALTRPAIFLSKARRFFQLHPDEQELNALAARGYTFTHAQLLLSIEPTYREEFLRTKMQNQVGRFLPTREVIKVMDTFLTDPVQMALALEDSDQPAPSAPPPAAPAPVVPLADGGPAIMDQPAAVGVPELPAPGKGEHRAAKTVKDEKVSFNRVMDEMSSLLSKLLCKIPDVLHALKEIGTDHEVTRVQRGKLLQEVRSGVVDDLRLLHDLQTRLDDELRVYDNPS